MAVDEWNQPFVYHTNGLNFSLISLGRDKKIGGTGWNADLAPITKKIPRIRLSWSQMQEINGFFSAFVSALICASLTFGVGLLSFQKPTSLNFESCIREILMFFGICGLFLIVTFIFVLGFSPMMPK